MFHSILDSNDITCSDLSYLDITRSKIQFVVVMKRPFRMRKMWIGKGQEGGAEEEDRDNFYCLSNRYISIWAIKNRQTSKLVENK